MKTHTSAVAGSALPETREPYRILVFTTLYPGAAQPNHGIFVENRLRHLVATGQVKAQVVAPVPWFPSKSARFGRYAAMARMPARESRYGIDIFHPRFVAIPAIGMLFAPWLLFAGTFRILWRLRHGFDLIDAHYFYPDGVAAALLGRALGKPVVITARGTDVNLIPRYRLPRCMIRWAARRAAGVVAVSQALKDRLVGLGIRADRVVVLPNGVDLEAFGLGDRAGARALFDAHGHVLLSVGRLVDLKGHTIVIAALQRLPECTLVIAGDGPQSANLRQLAAQLDVADRVRFLGAVPHRQLRELYLAADALVLASSHEGWPNVILEAIACGTPVVASNVGGVPEIVSAPVAGVLLKARTPQEVADAVGKLLHAPPRRESTRAFAEQFNWEASTAGQIRLFAEILRARTTLREPFD